MLWIWLAAMVVLAVGGAFLARWMNHRSDELPPQEGLLSDEERAQAQLGIALNASQTMGFH